MSSRNRGTTIVPIAAAAIALSGMGAFAVAAAPDSAPGAADATATTVDAAARPVADIAPAPPGTPGPCHAERLHPFVSGTDSGAGSTWLTVTLPNSSPETCTLAGYPGVSLATDAAGPQIGAAADREPGASETVTLAPGESATFDVRVTQAGNYDPAHCRPVEAGGLRIFPPEDTASTFLSDGVLTGCGNDEVHLLAVTPVRPAVAP